MREVDLTRDHKPTLFTALELGEGVEDVADLILSAWRVSGADRRREKGKGRAA